MECSCTVGKHVSLSIKNLEFNILPTFSDCQYVASTRIELFEKDDPNSAKAEMIKAANDIVRSNQVPEEESKDGDRKKSLAVRRNTVHELATHAKKVGGHGGEEVNLERQFKIRFANMGM